MMPEGYLTKRFMWFVVFIQFVGIISWLFTKMPATAVPINIISIPLIATTIKYRLEHGYWA